MSQIHVEHDNEDRVVRLVNGLAEALRVDHPDDVYWTGRLAEASGFEREHVETRRANDRLNRVLRALTTSATPDAAKVKEALAQLVNFRPDDTPIQFTDPKAHPYGAEYARRKDVQAELKQDSQQPFFCESYLYNLLGKEDARSLLARIEALCGLLGFEMGSLYLADPENAP